MKRLIVLLLAAFVAMSASAQNSKSIYNKYRNESGISSVYVSPSMFKMMGKVPNIEGADFSSVIKYLEAMYVIDCENPFVAKKLKTEVLDYAESKRMELMMEARDGDELVRVYTVTKDEFVTDFIMLLSENDECVFIGIEGKIDPATLGQVIASMDID